ncbi:MAG: hypothetical protein AMJ79_08910 [Phycisphaerae bacterium SM23_30]|nr:MAG: hypothetical protein AMJ79_08910 [Phycisphaerae bacterium SM23_30]
MAEESQLIDEIVDRYEGEVGMLIPMMQDLQAEIGYLPVDHLRYMGKKLEVPMSHLYAVATFYSSFRLAPKGAHEVTLCLGTVCYLKGAGEISQAICREFQVAPGGTTPDRMFSYNPVNCVGACALAPVMVVDGKYHGQVTMESALEILHGLSLEEQTKEATTAE